MYTSSILLVYPVLRLVNVWFLGRDSETLLRPTADTHVLWIESTWCSVLLDLSVGKSAAFQSPAIMRPLCCTLACLIYVFIFAYMFFLLSLSIEGDI